MDLDDETRALLAGPKFDYSSGNYRVDERKYLPAEVRAKAVETREANKERRRKLLGWTDNEIEYRTKRRR